MRKITQQTVNAFFGNSKLSNSNMLVSDGNVYLHGNLIAKKVNNTTIAINFCGWATNTTADRINAIVSEATNGKIKVGIKQGEPELRHANGYKQVIDSSEWIQIESLYF